jgi:signal transduction histidine kinase
VPGCYAGAVRRLGGKLVGILLLAGVLPLLASGFFAILAARDTALTAVREGNREVARRAAREIGATVAAACDLVGAAAAVRARAGLSPEQEARMLVGLKQELPVLANVVRVTADGAVVASTHMSAPPPLAAGDPALGAALRGERTVGAVITDDLIPRVRVALPVEELGRISGALIATLDLVAVWTIVDDIRLGATGRVLLLDRDGAVVAHGHAGGKAMVVRRQPLATLATTARAAAERGTVFEGEGSLGQRALSVAVPVPGTSWILVLEQDDDEAFAAARRLTRLLVALAAAAALVAGAAGVALARRNVLAPVRILERAAAEIGRDRLDHRVELRTGDELEDLGRALNHMAASLAATREELARGERARALGMLAGGLAHDLKHPVGSLQALLLRADRLPPDELDRRLAAAARRETPRLAALVELLRDLGRARARRDSEFDAGALAEAADGFRGRAEDRGVRLEVDVVDPRARVRGDRHMLGRAIENLLSNALEATPAGGRVGLAIAPAGGTLEVAVTDDGPGLAPAELRQLFAGLASTKQVEGGWGLGLFVVSQVTEAHGGRASAARAPEGGLRITLSLPILVGQSSSS